MTATAPASDAPAGPADGLDPRQAAALATLGEVLGEALLASHAQRGELWVRVHHEAWQQAGYAVRDKLGCRWFDFLSAIDWLPSPFGRDMDAEQDWPAAGPESRDTSLEPGVTGGETRLQVLARVQDVQSAPAPAAAIGSNGAAASDSADADGAGSNGAARSEGSGAEGAGGDSHSAGQLSIILKADLPNQNPAVQTWVPVYAGANWHEREAWEMFGIAFVGHPDLRHIYLPGEFEGYPLRKDFPLLARRVKPWPGIVDVEDMPEATDGAESGAGATDSTEAQA